MHFWHVMVLFVSRLLLDRLMECVVLAAIVSVSVGSALEIGLTIIGLVLKLLDYRKHTDQSLYRSRWFATRSLRCRLSIFAFVCVPWVSLGGRQTRTLP